MQPKPKTKKECTCWTTFKTVLLERRRLEEIIWRRAFDHFLNFNVSKVNCIYGSIILQVYHSVNHSLFHGIAGTSHVLATGLCPQPPWECALVFKNKAMRLTVFFYSYAASIRMLFTKHNALLERARESCDLEKPCKLPVQHVQYPPVDFSALVFRHINTLFFNGALRCRNINVPAAIVAKAEDKSYSVYSALYDEWLRNGGWEKAVASCSLFHGVPPSVAPVLIPVIDLPRVDPPPPEESSENVEIVFLSQ
jgi:hypothetical protein